MGQRGGAAALGLLGLLLLLLACALADEDLEEERRKSEQRIRACGEESGVTAEDLRTCHVSVRPAVLVFKKCLIRKHNMLTEDGSYDRDHHLATCEKVANEHPKHKDQVLQGCNMCMDEIEGLKGDQQLKTLILCECKLLRRREEQMRQRGDGGGGRGGGGTRDGRFRDVDRQLRDIMARCAKETGVAEDDLNTCHEDPPSDTAVDFFQCTLRLEGKVTEDDRFNVTNVKKDIAYMCKEHGKKEDCEDGREWHMYCPNHVLGLEGDEMFYTYTLCECRKYHMLEVAQKRERKQRRKSGRR